MHITYNVVVFWGVFESKETHENIANKQTTIE